MNCISGRPWQISSSRKYILRRYADSPRSCCSIVKNVKIVLQPATKTASAETRTSLSCPKLDSIGRVKDIEILTLAFAVLAKN